MVPAVGVSDQKQANGDESQLRNEPAAVSRCAADAIGIEAPNMNTRAARGGYPAARRLRADAAISKRNRLQQRISRKAIRRWT